jgi:uncharacterized protein YdeI (YjbR/CyaY-like superfamily)
MKRFKTVDEYISSRKDWAGELTLLREILTQTELEETVKWGAPVYTIANKNVVGLGAFKSYVGLWFFQGVFLADEHKVLISAQEGKTRGLRQWRFRGSREIDDSLITQYVLEAIENAKQGKEIKPEKREPVAVPVELQKAPNEDAVLEDCFGQLSPYKQREYAEHIGGAKREATRIDRLEESIPLIREKKGLNDRYR